MIRRANILEIPDILEVTKACTAYMIKMGIFQWNEHYPSREVFEKDVRRKELYVLEPGKSIAGVIAITTLMDEEYAPVNWLTGGNNAIYIHRLAVHPAQQGKGYAQKLMDYAESHARDNGFQSVRLDTFSQNKGNQKFYGQRGYQKLDVIHFPKQSDHPFHCYEQVF